MRADQSKTSPQAERCKGWGETLCVPVTRAISAVLETSARSWKCCWKRGCTTNFEYKAILKRQSTHLHAHPHASLTSSHFDTQVWYPTSGIYPAP